MALQARKAKTEGATDVTVPGTDTGISLDTLKPQIAMELAAGLRDPKAVRNAYGITDAQWEVIRRNPLFRSMLTEALGQLRGDTNAKKRIQLKASVAVEDLILDLFKMARDTEVASASRIEAAKLLASLGGHGGKEGQGGQAAPGFAIQINLGGDTTLKVAGTASPSTEALS